MCDATLNCARCLTRQIPLISSRRPVVLATEYTDTQTMNSQTGTTVITSILIACSLVFAPGPVSANENSLFSGAIETAGGMPRLHSLLISQGGELVVEEYFNGSNARQAANVKSVSKSFMSALVGIAIDKGYLEGIEQPIGDFYNDMLATAGDEAKRNITIGNLLSMQAGLESTSFRNYGAWVLSDDWIAFALQQPLETPPGTRLRYSTGNTHLLSGILTRATGMDTMQFARETLTNPLGITLVSWQTDPQGIYFGGNNMEFTPRHMLEFGKLYLNRGRANGRQIISESWIETSIQRLAESRREEGRFYGYGWWLRDMAGVEVHYAWGYGGQFIMVAPALDLVAVTTSSSQPGSNRRPHTRNLYKLLENEIVRPLQQAAGRSGIASD